MIHMFQSFWWGMATMVPQKSMAQSMAQTSTSPRLPIGWLRPGTRLRPCPGSRRLPWRLLHTGAHRDPEKPWESMGNPWGIPNPALPGRPIPGLPCRFHRRWARPWQSSALARELQECRPRLGSEKEQGLVTAWCRMFDVDWIRFP